MSNQLFGSMVRGFGLTLGRKAANAVTRPNTSPSKRQLKFEQERQEKIMLNDKIIEKFKTVLVDVEKTYKEGKISLTEYQQLVSECNDGIQKGESQKAELQGVSKPKSKFSWGWTLFIIFFVIPALIALFS